MYRKKILPLFFLVAFFVFSTPISFAAPKDDVHTLYYPDGAFAGYSLVATPSFTMSKELLPKMVLHKYFTEDGIKYTIRYPFLGDVPDIITKGNIVIGDDAYPLTKILVDYPEIKSEFSYLYRGPSFQSDPTLFEVPEEVISKIIEAPQDMPVYFSLQGLEADLVYYITFHTSILNGLPLLQKVSPENAEEYFKKKKGSGDPNKPKIIIKTP